MPGVKYFIKSNSNGNGKRLKLVDRSLYGGVFEIVHKGERREIVERPLLAVVFLDFGDFTKNRLGVDDHVVEVPLDGGALVVELDGGALVVELICCVLCLLLHAPTELEVVPRRLLPARPLPEVVGRHKVHEVVAPFLACQTHHQ